MKLLRPILLLAFCLLAPTKGLGAQETSERVNNVSISAPLVELSSKTLLSPLELKPGTTFSKEALEKAHSKLLSRGIFSHIDISTSETEYGTNVHFSAIPALSNYKVVFYGFDALSREELLRKANLRQGSAFDPKRILEAKQRIEDAYEAEGFFSPEIRVSFSQRSDLPFVIVKFRIKEGKKSRIEDVILEGPIPVDAQEISKAFPEFAIGLDASQQTLEELELTLLRMLRNEGYLEAYVRLGRMIYEPTSGGVILSFNVEHRDPISIHFSGNRYASDQELLGLLKMDSRKVPFGPNAIPNLVRLITRYYQQFGYYFVDVQYRELPQSGQRRQFKISIEEGESHQIGKIEFSGNKHIRADELRNEIETKQKSFGILSFWRSQHLVEEILKEDIFKLEEFYRSRGFPKARINAKKPTLNENDELEIQLSVIEGPPSIIEAVEIRWKNIGNSSSAIEAASPLFLLDTQLETPTLYSSDKLEEELIRIREEVKRLGYPNVSVKPQYSSKTQKLTFLVTPSSKTKVGKLSVRGSRIVPDWVVLREIGFGTGSSWDEETIRENEASLFELGIFQSAQIYPKDGDLDEEVEDLVVEVADRDTGAIGAALTYNTDEGIGLLGQLSQRNLFSRAQALDLTISGNINSGEHFLDSARMQLTFTEPRFLSSKTRFIAEGFFQKEIEFLNDYSRDRVGGLFNFSYEFLENLRASAGYSAFYEDVYDVPNDIVIGDADRGEVFYSLLTSQINYDARDDRFNPRSGFQAALLAQAALDELGSEVSFGSLLARAVLYTPIAKGFTWANFVAYEVQEPFGNSETIPLSQRLFLGGRTSLRGFSTNSLGPRGFDGNVVGGDRSLQINSEFWIDFSDTLTLLLFLDAGNAILNNRGNFSEDPESFSSLRYSPGIGLRYRTPIGPLGLDLGIPINQRSYEHPFRINFNIGGHF